jgi:hypothetical protein
MTNIIKHSKSIIIFIVLVFVQGHYFNCLAQQPSWTDPVKRKMLYPENDYLVAFYSENYDKSQTIDKQVQKGLEYAKTDIAESVQVSIHSLTTTDVTETNYKVQDFYNHKASLFTDITIAGLKTESCKDDKAKMVYSLAYAKKEDVVNYYKNEIRQKKLDAENRISEAGSLSDAGKKSQAIVKYYEVMPLIREMEQDQAIILALSPDLYIEEISKMEKTVNTAIVDLTNNPERTLDDVCFFIAEGLRKQVKEINYPVLVSMFTFQDSQMGSEFSARLGTQLQQKLVEQQFNVIEARSVSPDSEVKNKVIYGTYWKENESLKILAVMRDPESNQILASAGASLPLSWLESNKIAYLPDNYDEALNQLKAFRKDEIINGGLMIELMTNHGKDNVLYQEGDTLIMYVKANRECYIRVIYYQADGSKVLLQNDYFISSDIVNKYIELPQKNQASPPFGVETLQLSAQTGKFTPLNIKTIDGYSFIDEDLGYIVAQTRGFKKLDEANLAAEKRVTITTVKGVR